LIQTSSSIESTASINNKSIHWFPFNPLTLHQTPHKSPTQRERARERGEFFLIAEKKQIEDAIKKSKHIFIFIINTDLSQQFRYW
jgi:hypothetical protein